MSQALKFKLKQLPSLSHVIHTVLMLIVVEVQALNAALSYRKALSQPSWSNLRRVNCATFITGYQKNGCGRVIVTSTYLPDESINKLGHIVEGDL